MIGIATSIQMNGLHGWLYLLAAILFLIAAIVGWFVTPRAHWATFVAAGLMLVALGFIVA